MNLNGGFFCDSVLEAVATMQKMVGCRVEKCVYPTIKNLTYYISIHGDLFSVQTISGKILARGPKKTASKNGHGKRKDGGITHRLSNGKKGPGGESFVPAELLVYCTFTINRWQPDLKIDFVNGCATDIRPENLVLHANEIPAEWFERLNKWKDVYSSNFNRLVSIVTWWTNIDIDDAKDIVQSTFIYMCTDGYKKESDDFVGLWIYLSKLRAMTFKHDHFSHYSNESFDITLETKGSYDKPVEVDLFHLQKGDKRSMYLKLWSQGHTPTEIAEMCGSTIQSVSSSVTRSIEFLKKYFSHERKMYES